jgi:hypothetical protein
LGIKNEEATILTELRVAGKAQQAFLVFYKGFPLHDVEKFLRIVAIASLADHDNSAALFNDKKTAGMVRRFLHPERSVECQLREGVPHFDFWQGLRQDCRSREKCEGKADDQVVKRVE